jgi:hypothetical protein
MGAKAVFAEVSDEWAEAPTRLVGAGLSLRADQLHERRRRRQGGQATIGDDASATDAALAYTGTNYSTVTDFARLRGWSMLQPRASAT